MKEVNSENVNVHSIKGKIVWMGEMEPLRKGEQLTLDNSCRKIKIEEQSGKYTNTAYLLIKGEMTALFRWGVGDEVIAWYNMRAFETQFGTKGNCLVCWRIKNISDVVVL